MAVLHEASRRVLAYAIFAPGTGREVLAGQIAAYRLAHLGQRIEIVTYFAASEEAAELVSEAMFA